MRVAVVWFVMVAASAAAGAGEAWPQFRGPGGDGHSDAMGLPLRWSETENVVWKVAIQGRGWSSPVVWGRQVWLTTATADGKEMSAVAVDRDTGKVVHSLLLFRNAEPGPINSVNSYASPTPAIEAGRVYLHFGTYGTACLDTATGKPVWVRRDLNCDHGVGPGSSPVLSGDRLFLVFDGMDEQYVVALDKLTGRTLWKTPRDVDFGSAGGDFRKAFATPALIRAGGREQLVCPAAWAAMAYDPQSGREIWRFRYGRGYSTAPKPVYAGGLVLIHSGFGIHELHAVRPTGTGDLTETHAAWSLRGAPAKPSPLVVDGLVYLAHDRGLLTCLDLKTGERIYRESLPGKYSASPLLADGRIYLFDEKSTAAVVRPGREYKLLATNALSDGCMATPAVAGRSLFVRTKTHLYRIEQRPG
ncbi:MAG TPA: PQQ-binding-like beta-propeller repeat protein [Phycisphaerae bacterium]|nr:PQQ-binding-like beta-propeller repeat protein [Phycisphaerae bacterium]